MRPSRTSLPNALMLAGLTLAGALLWMLHADAWDLGGRSPALNFDTAQVALAARHLAQDGRLATDFALPIELAGHPRPPWPLTLVQPGLVGIEAVMLRALPDPVDSAGVRGGRWARPDQREWILLPFPFMCFLLIGASLGVGTRHLLKRLLPDASDVLRASAGLVVGLAFLLDPEAQHLATGPYSELPLTFGLVGAIAALALERSTERPFLFGVLLGLTASFGTHMPWIPVLLVALAVLAAPRERRAAVLGLAALGVVLPLSPWWFYQWRALGAPGRDLTHLALWDGIGGRTWFSIYHLPEMPDLPRGLEALGLLAGKLSRELPRMLLAMLSGPRALWLTSLGLWLALARPPRPLAIAAIAVLLLGSGGVASASLGIPWLRSAFPGRVLVEAAGLLAAWSVATRAAGASLLLRRAALVALAAVAIGWGALQTVQGRADARAASRQRGTPSAALLLRLAVYMNRELPAGEPVMSNLGPELAWHARRPVIHLALRPEDMDACRRRTEFRHVLLVFRDATRVWPGWGELFEHAQQASKDPALHIERARTYESSDGYRVVWLELGEGSPKLALR